MKLTSALTEASQVLAALALFFMSLVPAIQSAMKWVM